MTANKYWVRHGAWVPRTGLQTAVDPARPFSPLVPKSYAVDDILWDSVEHKVRDAYSNDNWYRACSPEGIEPFAYNILETGQLYGVA